MPNTKAKKIKILLIEDYPSHVEIIKRMLEKVKNPRFNLEHTDRLSTGLERFAREKFDAILLDLRLPDCKGLDSFLKLHDRALHIPIIVTTALDDEIIAVRAVQAGAQDYLVKGNFDTKLLKQSILYSIERKRVENFIQIQRNLGINLNGVRNLTKAFALVIDAATAIDDMDCGGIYLIDPTSGAIDLKYSRGLSANFVKQTSHYDKDSAHLRLLMKGKPVFIEYPKLKTTQYKIEHREGLKTVAAIPMLYQSRVIAYMTIASHTQKYISSSARHVLETIASQAGIAIARLMIEETLRESEERYRLLVENINLGITLVDKDYNIVMVNTAIGQMLNKNTGKLVGKKCFREFEKREEVCTHCPGTQAMASGLPQERDIEVALDDGTHVPVFIRAFPIINTNGVPSGFIEIVEDITERKLAEKKLRDYQKKLRSLASELSLTEERERRNIATDLHDHIGQSLAISRMKLKALQDSVSVVDLAHPLEDVQELIEQAIDYTRTLMFKLSSPMLYDLGFESAVEWLTEQLQNKHGISSSFKDDESPKPLDDEVRTLLFQAVRELLINIAKHAQAHKVEVSVRKAGKKIRIDIKDDGIGFDISQIGPNEDKTGGFGLFNIRERLDFIGGGFEIKSRPGQGTHVKLTASLKDEETPRNVG